MGHACADGGHGLALAKPRQIIEHSPGLLTLYSDGTFQRLTDCDLPACPDSRDGVASRDVVIDASACVWARLFLPFCVTDEQGHHGQNLPVVLHFHGGGFCVGTPASPHIHSYCSRMARITSCLWISVNYRLAPEHPLPAAYEDAYASLLWLCNQAKEITQGGLPENRNENAWPVKDDNHVKGPWEIHDRKHDNGLLLARHGSIDPWLARYADFSSCFLTGDSSGGTIVHYLAAWASAKDWNPLTIKGLLILHPAFPQEEPQSTDELPNLRVQFYHKSALPPGAPFGHPLMNPLHPDSPIKLSDISLPQLLVAVAELDPLRPGDLAYFHALLEAGHDAELFESRGVGHCFYTNVEQQFSAEAKMLESAILEFIRKLC